MRGAAEWVASLGGLGFLPVAPGTMGSLLGVGLLLATRAHPWAAAVGLVTVVAAGCATAGRVAARSGASDPSTVVIDEAAGMLVAAVGLPVSLPVLGAAFLLFRLFDICKPFPIRRLEVLPGALGIMADDLLAGGYARVCVLALWPILVPGVS